MTLLASSTALIPVFVPISAYITRKHESFPSMALPLVTVYTCGNLALFTSSLFNPIEYSWGSLFLLQHSHSTNNLNLPTTLFALWSLELLTKLSKTFNALNKILNLWAQQRKLSYFLLPHNRLKKIMRLMLPALQLAMECSLWIRIDITRDEVMQCMIIDTGPATQQRAISWWTSSFNIRSLQGGLVPRTVSQFIHLVTRDVFICPIKSWCDQQTLLTIDGDYHLIVTLISSSAIMCQNTCSISYSRCIHRTVMRLVLYGN